MNTSQNALSPDTPELNVIEYRPEQEVMPAEDDIKQQLTELFTEMFESIEDTKELTSDSPDVVFAKYLWVIKMKTEAIQSVNATAEKLIDEIEQWRERKTQQHQGQIDFLSARMAGYLKQQQLKSLHLPSGTIGLRKQQSKIEIVDSDKFYESVPSELLRYVPESFEPDLKKIREHIKTTGEVLVGLDVIEQEPKFYYKLN